MKNILLLVHDDAGQEARLQAALDVVRAIEGHLTCADIIVMPALVGDFYSGAGQAMLLQDERAREVDNKSALEGRLAHEGVSWDWSCATGDMANCLMDAAALTDLIVVNRQLDSFPLPDMKRVAAEIIVKSGKPVLAVPEASRGLDLCGTVLVAWDGSTAAAAALRAATPLLTCAEQVVLLEVRDGTVTAPAEEAATYLSRHGVTSRILRKELLRGDVATLILSEVRRQHADYVVMGGFGHARFVQAVFGGVTRRMLTECPVPVFLAH